MRPDLGELADVTVDDEPAHDDEDDSESKASGAALAAATSAAAATTKTGTMKARKEWKTKFVLKRFVCNSCARKRGREVERSRERGREVEREVERETGTHTYTHTCANKSSVACFVLYQLSSLLKLKDVKSNEQGCTLLHAIVE